MGPSGFQAVCLLVRVPGIMGRIIFTDTSTIISITAKAITDLCRLAASIQPNTVQSFTAKPCMTHVVMRHHAAIDNFPGASGESWADPACPVKFPYRVLGLSP